MIYFRWRGRDCALTMKATMTDWLFDVRLAALFARVYHIE